MAGFSKELLTLAIRRLPLQWLARQDYEQALAVQLRVAEEVRAGGEGRILACEHDAVVTLGKRGQALDDLLVGMDVLREQKIKIVATDRGGQATLHNPGQLVLYPILPLKRWGIKVREYVEALERTSAYFFAERGIEVERSYEPGLWVEGKKIAAFGIRVDRGVTLHGCALNVDNALNPFSLIRVCGASVPVTNLKCEMAKFMNSEDLQFDLESESSRWLRLFRDELLSLPYEKAWDPSMIESKLEDAAIPAPFMGFPS